jgi:hypothetical protein
VTETPKDLEFNRYLEARIVAKQLLAQRSPSHIELPATVFAMVAADAVANTIGNMTEEQYRLLVKRAEELAVKMTTDLVVELAGDLARELLER